MHEVRVEQGQGAPGECTACCCCNRLLHASRRARAQHSANNKFKLLQSLVAQGVHTHLCRV